MELRFYSFVAIGGGMFSAFGSLQALLVPEDTWVPIGVLVVAVTASVGATIKIVKFISMIEQRFDQAERQRKVIAKHVGISDTELDGA